MIAIIDREKYDWGNVDVHSLILFLHVEGFNGDYKQQKRKKQK